MSRLGRILFVLVSTCWIAPAFADSQTFINEIHYDNSGADTGEAVEIAGPAGTSLSGWQLVLYNGNGGGDYATYNLSGTLSDQCSGYGVVTVSTTGLQNGAPDGVALIDSSGIVREFISYEGTFTATAGPASGVTSTDIGVSESGSTPVGQSLQLAGDGSFASDFLWLSPATSSFGQCNPGETFQSSGGGTGTSSLENGTPLTGISGSQGTFSHAFTVDIPSGASNLVISMSGGSGDADMYVRFGAEPTLGSYDCRPYIAGNDETCSMTTQAGTYYVKLYGWNSYSNVTLEATWDAPSGGGTGGGSGGGSGYYAGVDTSSPTALRNSLHALIEQVTRIPYTSSSTDTWDVLEQADEDPLNGADVIDVYKNASYPKQGGGNTYYNREHTWPKSYGFPDDVSSNYAYTDMHMLMLVDSSYNSSRGNIPYGTCNASCREYPTVYNDGVGGGSGTYPGNSNWSNGDVWEVWVGKRGDVARALLYMDVRFEGGTNPYTGYAEPDLVLTDDTSKIVVSNGNTTGTAYMGKLSVLLQWAQQDPVSDFERLRNETVELYQGDRNPFVDHPEWIACVFQGQCQ
ncbi:MAG TPA: endonuclease [Rhodanobacteraceae bacterium]|nr:endonuclease [Rhodanobacteraceae bacterium]